MKNKILVFDDIIDLDYQNKIKNVLTTEDYQYKELLISLGILLKM